MKVILLLWPLLAFILVVKGHEGHDHVHEDTTVTEDEYYEETTEYGGTFVDNVRKAVIVGDEYIDEIISNGEDDEIEHMTDDEMTEKMQINELGAIFDSKTGKRRYDNYQILRVNPDTDEHLDVLQFLEKAKGMVEMWSPIPYNASLVDRVDILVSPRHSKHVKQYLNCAGMNVDVIEENLQKAIDEENDIDDQEVISKKARKCSRTGMNWNKYHRYSTIDNFVKCLASEFPDKATMFEIGKSYEGRNLNLLRISNNNRAAKDSIWIDGGIHAREWASPSSVTYMMQELLENSHKYKHILDRFNLYILPLANPDGYEYSHIKDRLWRKTRSNHLKTRCVGVDPNRNWGHNWGGQGASGDPCDETYYGPHAFSEPETAAIRNFILARKDSMKLYLTFHTYGQYILYPWGYARRDAVDKKDLHRMGKIGANAAKRVSGHKYSVGSAAKMLYPAAGGSDDWAKGGAGIKYSYTIELPDTGRYGFVLPASKALKTGREAMALTEAMIAAL